MHPSNARDARLVVRALPVELYRACDIAVVLGSLVLVHAILNQLPGLSLASLRSIELSLPTLLLLAAFLACWHLSFVSCELYEARPLRLLRADAQRLIAATLAPTAVLFTYLLLRERAVHGAPRAFAAVVAFWLCAFAATLALRRLLAHASAWRHRLPERRVLIIGSGPRAQRVRHLLRGPSYQCSFVGFVDSDRRATTDDARRQLLGTLDDLEQLLMRSIVDEVIIALPVKSKYAQIQQAIRVCEQMGIDVRYPADIFDSRAAQARLDDSIPSGSVSLASVATDYRQRIKRPVELALTIIALIAATPLLALIAAAIKLSDGGPVFFVQPRHGLHRRIFPLLKFRTMVCDAEAMQAMLEPRNEARGPVFKMHSDPRVTRLGAFLRRTSLDELPQLLNVIAGHMSLVGPRPLPLRDVSRFPESSAMRRFSVRPGITGLWQVSGRSELDFDQLVALDLRYIDEWSLWLDLQIVFRTFGAVVRRRGAV